MVGEPTGTRVNSALSPREGYGKRDAARRGRLLRLGAVAPVLMREVSESLAGLLAIVELAPWCAHVPAAAFSGGWACWLYRKAQQAAPEPNNEPKTSYLDS
jgi:hypothetical protein